MLKSARSVGKTDWQAEVRTEIKDSGRLCRPRGLLRNLVFSLPRSALCRALSKPLRSPGRTLRSSPDRRGPAASVQERSRVVLPKCKNGDNKRENRRSSADSNKCRENKRAGERRPDSRRLGPLQSVREMRVG